MVFFQLSLDSYLFRVGAPGVDVDGFANNASLVLADRHNDAIEHDRNAKNFILGGESFVFADDLVAFFIAASWHGS